MIIPDREKALERLKASVEMGNSSECWICTTAPTSSGYGSVSVQHRTLTAHRLSFSLYWGVDIPSRLHVCHDCPGGDNKLCCNPAHLLIGDAKWHASDKKAKGQIPTGDQSWPHKNCDQMSRGDRNGSRTKPERRPRGSQVVSAKLTELQVIGIMARWLQGVNLAQVGREFGVNETTVGRIVHGKAWKHVFER